MNSPAALQVLNLSKHYDDFTMAEITFTVPKGAIAAMLGPSGAGKTTLLRLIAGLEEPDEGDIAWQGESVIGLPAYQRKFGLMVQDYALFPHMTVAENIGFGVQMAGADRQEIKDRTLEMLKLVGLDRYGDRSIDSLSGGEKQRVALARSLAPRPRLLMLDEPLGSLDRALRDRLVVELPQMLAEVDQTAIYVTHDQDEAFAVASQLILLNGGRIEQVGSPEALYRNPQSAFTARFLGLDNIIKGKTEHRNGELVIATPLGEVPAESSAGSVDILVRPEAFDSGDGGPEVIQAEVRARSFRGELLLVRVRLDTSELNLVFRSSQEVPPPGQKMTLSYDLKTALQVLP